MRIGIDFHLAEREGTGNCTYMRNLVERLVSLDRTNAYLLYVTDSAYAYYRTFDSYPHVSLRSLGAGSPPVRMLRMGLMTYKDRIDILHANYYGPPFFRGKLILTVHDLSFLAIPECFTAFERVKDQILIPHNVRRAFKVMTVSEFSKEDIVRNYHVPPDHVEVGYNGAGPLFKPLEDREAARAVVKSYGVTGEYILYVGRLNKRKNLRSLVAAYGALKTEKGIPHQLVVGGVRDFLPPDEMEEISRSPWKNELIFTGFLPEEHLPLFYGLADVFVYPSLYEGFGLPCLEAMSSGCPVISSDLTSLPEVVGDAGILLDPLDVKGLGDAIFRVVSNDALKSEMRAKGFQQAKKFGWDKTAMKMLEIMKEVSRDH
ncbi:MAG TPA: glycosyltransferase family 1 protein [Syntrophorhabdaceae bacterium]